MTHDDTASLYKADTDLYEFFLKNKNALNNSFIFIMADHGPRIGEVQRESNGGSCGHGWAKRQLIIEYAADPSDNEDDEAYTYFGLREQNNPLLYIVVPKHLRKSGMHEQLLENSGELVTPHDLHSTLKDILYFQPESTFTDLKYKRFDSNPYGSSLLRKFESGVRRSCKTLPIPFQYCICQYEKKIITDKRKLAVLGNYSVARLVSTLDSHEVLDECQPIALSEVLLAEEYLLPDRNFLGTSIHLYYVVFTVALPAEGKFEVFIREDENGDLYLDPLTFLRIDRIYHKTSCIDIDKLFGLCTCKRA
ncbi:hypothetical protein TELCIR_02351 [Teladorsagia circumcincta]|uniref:Uncharacterized protein n=1 Tax=Teladorsagia circumcincta TaxID=45464 RepID=A0A2G9V1G4_TELCI|nr:hypothetical protein TELCIR_02351 [Teladorsagia circumcincta]